jgi:ribosomal protein S18 acetylase RimI-like enzyme
VADLERVAALGWRAADEEHLGDWLLRAAAGFTGRANSALATGDPGLPLPEAVAEVRRWYASRGLPAMVADPFALPETGGGQDGGAAGGELAGYLTGLGWGVRPGAAMVMTALPAAIAGREPPAGVRIELAAEPDAGWLGRYRYRGQDLPPAALALLLSAPWQAFASARAGGQTVAVGRVAAADGWGGLTAVEVAPGYRRQGLASAITAALAAAAAARGAAGVYLQVESRNLAARALYRRVGFTDHHGYRYRVAPATS